MNGNKQLAQLNRRMPYLKYLGISFWIAWFGLAYSSTVWVQASVNNAQAISSMFNLSTVAHIFALVVLACAHRRATKFMFKPAVLFAAGVGAMIGCGVIVAELNVINSGVLFIVGCMLTGVFTSIFAINSGTLLCSTSLGNTIKGLLFAELMAALIRFTGVSLPGYLGTAMFSLLPLCSAFCFAVGSANSINPTRAEAERLTPNRQFILLLTVVFILSVATYVSTGSFRSAAALFELTDAGTIANFTSIIALVIITLIAYGANASLNFSNWFYPLLVVVIISLLISYLMPEHSLLGYVMSNASFQIFDTILWYTLAYFVQQSKVSSVFVFAAGRAVMSTGVTLGNMLGSACNASAQTGGALSTGIYLSLLVLSLLTFLIMPERQINRLLMPIPDEDAPDKQGGAGKPNEHVDASDAAPNAESVACQEGTAKGAAGAEGVTCQTDNAKTATTPPASCQVQISRKNAKQNGADDQVTPSTKTTVSATETAVAAHGRHSTWRENALAFAAAHNLTDREKEVFLLLARGRGSQSISNELTISLYTTRAHTRNIYSKLDVHSRQELIDATEAYCANTPTQ